MVDRTGTRPPAKLRFRPFTGPEDRLRFRWKQDPAGQPYRDAAIAWLTTRLREPIHESAAIVARDTADPLDTRTRWWTVREHLGELDRLTVTEHRDLGPLAAAAGSYEPEVHGHGPTRVEVTLIALASGGAANFVVRVSFPEGMTRPPDITLEKFFPRATRPPPTASTPDERALERLSEAVCAVPDDDEPRAAIAELWRAWGDPRGEFVRAQLAGDEARAAQLLAEHGAHWTDGLPVAPAGRVYQRGFLGEARVECSAYDLRLSFDNPAWNLLTGLHLGVMPDVQPEFLQHARITSLRRLTHVHVETLATATLPPRITHLQVYGQFVECPPGITTLELSSHCFEHMWIFARQEPHDHLAYLSVSARAELQGADLLVVQGLLAAPRPACLVLIGQHKEYAKQPVETWRLIVRGDDWQFTGDESVLQQLRAAASAPDDELL